MSDKSGEPINAVNLSAFSFLCNQRILIADDFKVARMLIRKTLVELGAIDIEEADSGYVAFDKLKRATSQGKPFDIVFSDWMMPVLSGVELFSLLQGNDDVQPARFILFSADTSQEAFEYARARGISVILPKPICKNDIKEILLSWKADLGI